MVRVVIATLYTPFHCLYNQTNFICTTLPIKYHCSYILYIYIFIYRNVRIFCIAYPNMQYFSYVHTNISGFCFIIHIEAGNYIWVCNTFHMQINQDKMILCFFFINIHVGFGILGLHIQTFIFIYLHTYFHMQLHTYIYI